MMAAAGTTQDIEAATGYDLAPQDVSTTGRELPPPTSWSHKISPELAQILAAPPPNSLCQACALPYPTPKPTHPHPRPCRRLGSGL